MPPDPIPACVHMEARQSVPQQPFVYLVEKASLAGLELTNLIRVIGQLAPGICLTYSPILGLQTHAPHLAYFV